MEQIAFSIQLDAVVTLDRPDAPGARWPDSAEGILSASWTPVQGGETMTHQVYRGPLTLQAEDYSRGEVVSVRYRYVLEGVALQRAKTRLLALLAYLQDTGWNIGSVVTAVQQGALVDRDGVRTRLVWAVQVQYRSGTADDAPRADTFPAVLLSERVERSARARCKSFCSCEK